MAQHQDGEGVLSPERGLKWFLMHEEPEAGREEGDALQ